MAGMVAYCCISPQTKVCHHAFFPKTFTVYDSHLDMSNVILVVFVELLTCREKSQDYLWRLGTSISRGLLSNLTN